MASLAAPEGPAGRTPGRTSAATAATSVYRSLVADQAAWESPAEVGARSGLAAEGPPTVSAWYDRTYCDRPCPVVVAVDERRLLAAQTEHSARSARTYFALLGPAVVVSLLCTLRLVAAAISRFASFGQRSSARPPLVSAAAVEDIVHLAAARLEAFVHVAAAENEPAMGLPDTASVLHHPLTSAQQAHLRKAAAEARVEYQSRNQVPAHTLHRSTLAQAQVGVDAALEH